MIMKAISLVLCGAALGGYTIGQAQTPPTISRDPTNQCVTLGEQTTLSVTASGSPPLSIQWRFEGADIPGATNRLLVLTNLQYAHAGAYSVLITNEFGAVWSPEARLTVVSGFAKVTDPPFATDSSGPGTCAWGDYDDDGFIDLFVGNWETRPVNNWLYHNLGNGTFSRVTNNVIATSKGACNACAWGDVDNDGKLDLYVCNAANSTKNTNSFYRNLGSGIFSQITTGAVAVFNNYGVGVTWQDYDNDGYLDLLVAVNIALGANFKARNVLLHNSGDGSFTPATDTALSSVMPEQAGAWGDYDEDGRLELVQPVVNSGWPQLALFDNQGEGVFTTVANEISQPSMQHQPGGALAWADYDNDGSLDLFMGGRTKNGVFFHNQGGGVFDLVLEPSDWGIAAAWGDFDNDGFQDLFVPQSSFDNSPMPRLYHNNRDGTFTQVSTGKLVRESGYSASCAWGDYDNDGFLDLAFDQGTSMRLYHNNGNTNNWLMLKLAGTTSNRSAIGAKVRVKATINHNTFWQMREISGGLGVCQSDLRPHFGLGDATVAEVVRIEWPSGIVQELTNVPARQILTVTEPVQLHSQVAGSFRFRSWKGLVFEVQSSSDCTSWSRLATATNLTGTLEFSDPEAPRHDARFYRVVGK
jgi:hypothetical protein